jgi:hypothetical protein
MAERTRTGQGTRTTLLVVNGVGALLAAAFAGAGVARPSIAEPKSTAKPNTLAGFWSASSAIRTWAITGPFLITLLTGRPSTQLVTAAGIVQLGDAVLGFRQRNTAMTIAPAVMGVVHLITTRILRR